MKKKTRMFQALLIVTILLLQIVIPIVPSIAVLEYETIQFKDANLYNAIKETLGNKVKSSSEENLTITLLKSDIQGITKLDLYNKGITNISGIEHFTNLTELNLFCNSISDIKVLSSLMKLTNLNVGSNKVSDISSLSGLTNLKILYLGTNQIKDISALSGLTNLTHLNSISNQISDISVLSGLTKLTMLSLAGNQIKDISVVSGLTNLTDLYLGGNQISDISAVSGLTNLTRLDLWENQISDISSLSRLTNIKDLSLDKNQINDISSLSGLTKLDRLLLHNNQISDISVLSGLTNLTTLSLASNQISDSSAISGLTKLTWLSLCKNEITKNISNTEDEIELPPIFIQAKDKNSKIYTEQEYKLENCELSQDKTKVTLIDKKQNATVEISGGDATGTLFTIVVESETPKMLESIKITKAPTKIGYIEGESFDKAGMEVTACYSDGTEQVITNYTVTNGEKLATGQTSVTISYTEGEVRKEATQAITVKEKTLESIKITKAPTKIGYIEGESFDKAGMEVTACYSDGTEQVITNYTVTNGEKLAKGQTSVTISYTEGEVTKTATQKIKIQNKQEETEKPQDYDKNETPKKDDTASSEKIPNTGTNVPVFSGIAVMFITAIVSVIKIKRLSGI